MKKLKFNLLTGLLLLISVSVFAAGFPPPDKVQETFQKMYPKVTTVDWQRKGDYHIADIRVDGRELNVWFSDKMSKLWRLFLPLWQRPLCKVRWHLCSWKM